MLTGGILTPTDAEAIHPVTEDPVSNVLNGYCWRLPF